MRVEVDHSEIQELLGAYALHAVDAAEAAAVEVHVDFCSECREELTQHREVASLLSATEKFAPAQMWDTIVSQIHDDPESKSAPEAARSAVVVPLRRSWLRPVATAAAVALIVGATVAQSVRLGAANNELAAEQAKVAALTEQIENSPLDISPLDAAATQALAGAASRRLLLGSEANGSSAIIVVMPDGTGYLTEHTLQPLPPDRTYQLWAIVDGRVISAGILGSVPGVVPFRIDPQGLEGFAITEETRGGVATSQNEPIVLSLET
jgi:anti-sigma-K factor RskA